MEILRELKEVLKRDETVPQRIFEKETWYQLGDQWISGSSSTSLCVDGKEGMTYSLASLLFFWEYHLEPHHNYVRAATENGVPAVTRRDRNPLINYLKLEADESILSVEEGPVHVESRTSFPQDSIDVEEMPKSISVKQDPAEELNEIPSNQAEQFAIWRKKRAENKAKKQQKHKEVEPPSDSLEERTWTDRNTILNATGKADFRFLIDKWNILQKKNSEKVVKQQKSKDEAKVYSRYDQERFDEPSLDFQHNTFQGRFDSNAIRSGSYFSGKNTVTNVSAGDAKTPKKTTKEPASPLTNPIIVVPPETPATIFSLRNCLSLLEKRCFKSDSPPLDLKNNNRYVKMKRLANNKKCQYTIVDDVRYFTEEDWKRVIAVFVMGPEWQFKDFKMKNITEIFTRWPCFYVHYDDQPVHKNVQKWNVTVIGLNKMRRHLDVPKMMEFWKKVDYHVLKRSVEANSA